MITEIELEFEDGDVNPVDRPDGDAPEGWEDLAGGGESSEDIRPLLLIRRGTEFSANAKVDKLMEEMQLAKDAAKLAHAEHESTYSYLKKFLHEMAEKDAPIPQDTPKNWLWFLYIKLIKQEIDDTVEQALRKKRRKKKKRKKRRKRATSQSSSSSESSSSSAPSDEPNGRRVKSKAYNGMHYEQLQEFRDDYAEYYRTGSQSGWPSNAALSFIGKKFARVGS